MYRYLEVRMKKLRITPRLVAAAAAVLLVFLIALINTGENGVIASESGSSTSGAAQTAASGQTSAGSGTTAAQTSPTGPKIVWNSAVSGISTVTVRYSSEELEVVTTRKLYYAVLKKAADTGAKPAEVIPAAGGNSSASGGGTYIIDFSVLSSSKDCYIGLSTSAEAGSNGLVPMHSVTLAASERKIVFNPNWSIEGTAAGGTSVLSSVVVTNTDSTTVTYVNGTPSGESQKSISLLSIQWHKGVNGIWQPISTLSSARWESMKSSGATVYFRLDALNSATAAANTTGTGQTGHRYSKENKIKLNTSKASNIKLDVSKLTVGFKNGMQFRVSGQTNWVTILPYSGSSTITATAIRSNSGSATFDPYTENTQVKITYLSVADVLNALGTTAPAAGQSVTLEVRTAATTKKPASRISTLTIPAQAAAPTATVTYGDKGWTVSNLAAPDTSVAANFEFALVFNTDVTNNKIDMSTLKWSAVKNGTVLKNTQKGTYTTIDKSRRTVTITDADAVLLIRRKGVTGSAKAAAALASRYVVIQIPRTAGQSSGSQSSTSGSSASGGSASSSASGSPAS